MLHVFFLERARAAHPRFKNHPRPAQVGDFVSNATARTRWTNVAVEADGRSGAAPPASCGAWERANACGDEASLECFSHEMACSHDAQTRAFEGYAGSGPLMLDVDFNRNARCAVLISEPTSTGPKPITTANWDLELRVTVEGAPCRPPACSVVSGDETDATQSLYIDLTQIDDCDECKTCWMLQPVHIDIEVAPLAETGADVCVFNRVEINRRFRASPPNFRNL